VGVQVGLRRLDRFMPEPQRDHGAFTTDVEDRRSASVLLMCGGLMPQAVDLIKLY
jgi:hypothetical protein